MPWQWFRSQSHIHDKACDRRKQNKSCSQSYVSGLFRSVVWFLGYVSLRCLSKSAHLPGQVEPALSRWLWRQGGFTWQVKLHYLIFPDNHSPALHTTASSYWLIAWEMLKSQKRLYVTVGIVSVGKNSQQMFAAFHMGSCTLCFSGAQCSPVLHIVRLWECRGGELFWLVSFLSYTCFCNEATVHTGNPTC